MDSMKRHVGKLKNSDRRCAVVYMQLPGLPTHSLVVDMDALPPMIHDMMIDILESATAQQSTELGPVLQRQFMRDTGEDVLTALHHRNHLQKMPVENVIMFPRPNQPIPLVQLLRATGKLGTPQPVNEGYDNFDLSNQPDPNDVKFNPFLHNMNMSSDEDRAGAARNLVAQAELLEADARRLREQAYSMAPQMRPHQERMQPRPVIEEAAPAPKKATKPKPAAKPATRRKNAAAV
jgi:hypothetical protein